MKRAFSLVMLLVCLFIIYQFGINFIKQTHDVTYRINNNREFTVNESFKNNSYYFTVDTEGYKFIYKEDNLFNKMRNVVKNIEYIKEGNMLCIYPFYEKVSSQIICSDSKGEYTYESTPNKELVSTLYNNLKNNGYTFKIDEDEVSNDVSVKDNISYYEKNYNESEYINIWSYDKFIVFNNNRSLNVDVLDFDRYDNTLSCFVDKYYVAPLYISNTLFEFNKLYVYNVISNKNYEIDLGMTFSNYTYINGIIGNKLYLMDKENLRQVSVDVVSKKVEVVGNKESDAVDYNGEFSKRNIYDFVNQDIKFSFDDSNLHEKYQYDYVLENDDSYYFYNGNELYQVFKSNLDIPILIVSNSNLKDIKVKNETVYYIYSDTIYKYENNSLIKPMIKYNELLYNSSSMYDIYNK